MTILADLTGLWLLAGLLVVGMLLALDWMRLEYMSEPGGLAYVLRSLLALAILVLAWPAVLLVLWEGTQ